MLISNQSVRQTLLSQEDLRDQAILQTLRGDMLYRALFPREEATFARRHDPVPNGLGRDAC